MESSPEDVTEGLAIVRVLAAVLERLVAANNDSSAIRAHHLSINNSVVTKFHAMKAPAISVEQYLERYDRRPLVCEPCRWLIVP
jgi:hypothetical protein